MKTKKKKIEEPKIIQNEIISNCPDGGDILKQSENIINAINNATKNKNKEFSEMTKMEKRVAVARDVIASIKSLKYNTEAGTYLTMTKRGCDEDVRVSILNLKKPDVVCNVCAIGSMFVSNIKKTNTNSLSEKNNKMISSLSELYTERELRFLEFAFEGSDVDDQFQTDEATASRHDAKSFYREHGYDEDRLISIMKNIIKHKGKFVYGTTKF